MKKLFIILGLSITILAGASDAKASETKTENDSYRIEKNYYPMQQLGQTVAYDELQNNSNHTLKIKALVTYHFNGLPVFKEQTFVLNAHRKIVFNSYLLGAKLEK